LYLEPEGTRADIAVDECFFSECLLQLVKFDQLESQRAAQKLIAINVERMAVERLMRVGDRDAGSRAICLTRRLTSSS
jgi:hypothetical protein